MSDSSDPRGEAGPTPDQALAPTDGAEDGGPPPDGYDPADSDM